MGYGGVEDDDFDAGELCLDDALVETLDSLSFLRDVAVISNLAIE